MNTTPTIGEATDLLDTAIRDYITQGWDHLAQTYRAALVALVYPSKHTDDALAAVVTLVRCMANGDDTVPTEALIEFLRDGDKWFA